jgi:mono/diheme cytochrome c family protein
MTFRRLAAACGWILLLALVAATLAWLATVAFGSVRALGGPAPEADAAAVARGEYLARMGNCIDCHTAPGGKPFAGGLPMATPIGTLYTNNITPDPETGIGDYSLADFDRAVRHGVRRDGSAEYPAMPFPSYARVTDADLRDMYAYFMHGVAPVAQADRPSTIPWPLSMRWPMTWWRWLFAPAVAPFAPAPGQDDAQLARGAYLVEGLGHCGACHTPRAVTMQEVALTPEEGPRYLAGSDAPVDGWIATNLRGDEVDGLGTWSRADLAQLLKTGHGPHGSVFGNMTDVVAMSTQYLSDADRDAIAAFLKSLPARPPGAAPAARPAPPAAGAPLYAAHCAACHGPAGGGVPPIFPALAGNPVMNSASPVSLIRITLAGSTPVATAAGGPPGPPMPAYAAQLDDRQVADLVGYIRGSWGNQGGPVTAKDVAAVRKTLAPAHP